jgi:hypothetical protein
MDDHNVWCVLMDLARGFADDLDISNDGIPVAPALLKGVEAA